MKIVLGLPVPRRGLTVASCLRWPMAVGVDTLRMTGWGNVYSVAFILGPIEVSVTLFWS